jgi:hypothetical protein
MGTGIVFTADAILVVDTGASFVITVCAIIRGEVCIVVSALSIHRRIVLFAPSLQLNPVFDTFYVSLPLLSLRQVAQLHPLADYTKCHSLGSEMSGYH